MERIRILLPRASADDERDMMVQKSNCPSGCDDLLLSLRFLFDFSLVICGCGATGRRPDAPVVKAQPLFLSYESQQT